MQYAIAEVPDGTTSEQLAAGFTTTTAKIAMLRLPLHLFKPSADEVGPIMRTMVHQVRHVSAVRVSFTTLLLHNGTKRPLAYWVPSESLDWSLIATQMLACMVHLSLKVIDAHQWGPCMPSLVICARFMSKHSCIAPRMCSAPLVCFLSVALYGQAH